MYTDEYVQWLRGVVDATDGPPSPELWEKITDKLGETISHEKHDKILKDLLGKPIPASPSISPSVHDLWKIPIGTHTPTCLADTSSNFTSAASGATINAD